MCGEILQLGDEKKTINYFRQKHRKNKNSIHNNLLFLAKEGTRRQWSRICKELRKIILISELQNYTLLCKNEILAFIDICKGLEFYYPQTILGLLREGYSQQNMKQTKICGIQETVTNYKIRIFSVMFSLKNTRVKLSIIKQWNRNNCRWEQHERK